MKLLKDKKAMEMWQLVMMILALILLIFVIAWYAGLSDSVARLLEKMGAFF